MSGEVSLLRRIVVESKHSELAAQHTLDAALAAAHAAGIAAARDVVEKIPSLEYWEESLRPGHIESMLALDALPTGATDAKGGE